MSRFAFFLIVYWLGATAGAAAEPKRTPADYEKIDTFVNEPLDLGGAKSLSDLRKIGKLIREKVEVVDNRHEPTQKDEIRTLEFDGLTIHAYFPAQDHLHPIIMKIVVSKPQWKLRNGLAVGAAVKEVEAVLGEPDERAPDHMKYCGDVSCGTFVLRANRVTKVVFKGDVD